MQDKIGIEIKLTENLAARLRVIIPLMEKLDKQVKSVNQSLNNSQGFEKVTRSLETMNRQLRMADQSARNLNNVSIQMDKVANHASRAASKVGLLKRAMGGITGAPMALAGMLGGFASIYTIANMANKGMDFEQQIRSLQLAGLSSDQLKRAQDVAKRTAADSRFITTPTEVMESIRIGTAISRNPEEAIRMAPLGAEFNRAMRQIHATGADDHNQSEFAYKMAEQLGVRDEKRMKELMDMLTKAEISFAGQLDMQKLTQQLSMTRNAKYGADLLPLLIQLGHLQTESGGGSSGSGGRAGVQIQALNRILMQGVMTQAVAERFMKLGLISGSEVSTSHKGKPGATWHKTVMKDGIITEEDILQKRSRPSHSGLPRLTKAEIGNLVTTGLVDRELAIKDTPQWVYRYLIPAINKKEHVDIFKLSQGGQDDRTKAVSILTKWLSGMSVNALDFVTQLSLQHKTFGGQLTAAKNAPDMDHVMKSQLSMRTHLQQLEKAWDTFGTTLTSNDHYVRLFNDSMSTMTKILLDMTRTIDPVLKFFDQMNSMFNNWIGFVGGGLGKTASQASVAGQAIFPDHQGRLTTHTKSGQDWNAKLRSELSSGKSPAHVRIPPPPPYTPNAETLKMYGAVPGALSIDGVGGYIRPSSITVHQHFAMGSGMDHEKAKAALVKAVAPGLAKMNSKATRIQHYAGSASGGAVMSSSGYSSSGH